MITHCQNETVGKMRIRRRDTRLWFVGLSVFFAVFLFTFLRQSLKNTDEVEAANLANFDPGYIISDYQMGNYSSMTEAEIQAFLTVKNPCDKKDETLYKQLTAGSAYKWHFENGHFVCLSEELFGDGEVIGEGETAAHIIWQAAQDYKINPQVLIVLLQKETGLITDKIPNNGDYRKATGYGCPDTAPCAAEYYGFKNQVRKAAALFHTVLTGGWTNYPLGNNYIQYNPSAACGGSVVNVRNLATSALYRYTPYQPNEGALAAGYGTAYCGSYGNRNFYHYFEDWFGGITQSGVISGDYEKMTTPRILYVTKSARYIDPKINAINTRKFASFEYFTHLNYQDKNLCLSIGDKKNCYIYADLEEIEVKDYEEMSVARMLIVKTGTKYIDFEKGSFGEEVKAGSKLIFTKKLSLNGQLCLQTQDMVSAKKSQCILYENLQEISEAKFSNMVVPRSLYIKSNAKLIDASTGVSVKVDGNKKEKFTKLTYWFGDLCLQRESDKNTKQCILYKDLIELEEVAFKSMTVPRFLQVKSEAKIYDVAIAQQTDQVVEKDEVVFFDQLTYSKGKLCLKSSSYEITAGDYCILYTDLVEINNFTAMDIPRTLKIKSGTKYFDVATETSTEELIKTQEMYFVDKIIINGELYLRSKDDAMQRKYQCVKYVDLIEK